MNKYVLKYELQPLDELDKYALLACQKYNYGNEATWFNAFRGGWHGCLARIQGLVIHYSEIHSWRPKAWSPTETEYHLASIFFNMDSAIECFTFSLNAFGYGVDPDSFIDVTEEKELKKIKPQNIIGKSENDKSTCVSGYEKIFPSIQNHWNTNRALIEIITDQHDVSKHRETIFMGGKMRNDPPVGFYESLGMGDDEIAKSMIKPMAEIILRPDPKTPHKKQESVSQEDKITLEKVVNEFTSFINITVKQALIDAKSNIILKNNDFIKA
jgi:hypothetical protein